MIKRPLSCSNNFIVKPGMILNGRMIEEQIPEEVNGIFDCSDLGLTTLEGCPTKVISSFKCNNNFLTDLKGAPKYVLNHFYSLHNNLTSLEGCPIFIQGNLRIQQEYDLLIEQEYIRTPYYDLENYGENQGDAYWLGLLKYMINNKKDLNLVKGWPKGFLNEELISSVSSISKFNL